MGIINKYKVDYAIESEFTDSKIISFDMVCTTVKPNDIDSGYLKNVLESLINLKEGTFISIIDFQWLNGYLEDDKVENSKDYIELDANDLDVLNDVLMEIGENRCFDEDDGVSLEKLKAIFNYKLVSEVDSAFKKVLIRIDDNSKVENVYTLNPRDVTNLRNALCYSADKVKLLPSDDVYSLNWLVGLFDKNFMKSYEKGKAEVKLIIDMKV